MSNEAHCQTCRDYEEGVMAARKEGLEPAAELVPCGGYVMTDPFRDWLTESFRREVLGAADPVSMMLQKQDDQ